MRRPILGSVPPFPLASTWMWIAAVLLGLIVGSFLNVCIVRLPRHLSIVGPRSYCPRCEAPVRARDNVPVVSWLLLGGRCRDCREPISFVYPLVEAGYAGLIAVCLGQFGFTWQAAGSALFCFFALGLLVMDGATLLLPDAFTLPGLAVGLVWAFTRPFLEQREPATWQAACWSLAGAAGSAVVWAFLLLAMRWGYYAVRRREGLGLGDIKLVAMLGAWLGFSRTALSFLVAVVAGAGFGAASLAVRSQRRPGGDWRAVRLPLGAFLCAAGIFALFFGDQILRWYFNLWR